MPPIDLATVERFESSAGIRVPDDYRDFLLTVANGGQAPCRLVPLDEWSNSYWIDQPQPWMLAEPCIVTPNAIHHGDKWIDRASVPDWKARWDRGEWSPMFGTIAIAEIGCGLFFSLVATGPFRGRVFSWGDHASNPPRFADHHSFMAWFESCVDAILAGKHVHFLDGRLENQFQW
jgi:SMI1/KNR4 family protein SUKH-1